MRDRSTAFNSGKAEIILFQIASRLRPLVHKANAFYFPPVFDSRVLETLNCLLIMNNATGRGSSQN